MLIDVRDILKTGGLAKTLELELTAESCGIYDDECAFTEPIRVKVELANVNGVIRAKGDIGVGYETRCARCLKPIRCRIGKKFDEQYVRAGVMTAGQEEDADVYEYSDREIDLSPVVRDAVLLEIPIRNLCGEDCKSLCPVCGKDLNEGDCGCTQQTFFSMILREEVE